MSDIRCIYKGEPPTFSATDQHPDAVRYQVGEYWVDAVGGEPTLSQIEDLLTPRSTLLSQVDADAERVRLRYITPGAGMAMTYIEKRDQANAVHGMGQQAANALTEQERTEQFPTLAASVGLEAPTLWDCAILVIQRAEAWATLSNAIERTRFAGKKAISDASDAAAARAAYEAITWPTP